MDFKGASILTVDQFDLGDLERIFSTAEVMEDYAFGNKITKVLEGAILANLFFEPSTRSRVSFGCAFNRLGGSVRDTTGFTFSSMSKGESIYDTSRVISGYADIMVVRHPEEGSVAKFTKSTNIPIVNGGDGIGEHPTQALLDLYTIYKETNVTLRSLNNVKISLIGDLKHGRTAHSLAKLLSIFKNIHFKFVSPQELGMPDSIVEMLRAKGHHVQITSDFINGIRGSNILYITRVQDERFPHKNDYKKFKGSYSLTVDKFKKYCNKDTKILHPLPRDSRELKMEIDNNLNNHPNLAIFRQTDNGIPIRMALFALIMGVEDKIYQHVIERSWFRPSLKNKM
ncbi:MAG: aspartate carbamoyltransferase [Cytophagales bacterium]|nr:aspartate carbamoyltransferase [Cytophagales bacterium]